MQDFNTTSVLFGILGLLFGAILMYVVSKTGLSKSKLKAEAILKDAESQAKQTLKQAQVEAKTQAHEYKLQVEKDLKERKQDLQTQEDKLIKRENSLNFRDESLLKKEQSLEDKLKQAENKKITLDKMEQDLQARIDGQIALLEKVSNMSEQQAKQELMQVVEKKIQTEISAYIKEEEEKASLQAREISRGIIVNTISKYAQEEVIERTISTISIPNDEMKGRLIGREGRNIRAIEQATGVDLLIDDTPETITISSHDPIRREIAKCAIEALIRDGRIQPGRIEDVVEAQRKEIENKMLQYGEEAIFTLKIGKMDKELVKLLGRMRYRYSYGQNGLQHSIEVATFAGIMAAELGLNQSLAKRAGLLHDIGKAIDFEQEGTHVELGSKVAKKYNENEVVINSIESHHGEKPPTSLISILVGAADTLSAARPGARHQDMQNYIERLEKLEAIACDFKGVEKAFAIQAGREIRVIVKPEHVDDKMTALLAHDIKTRVENELTYPGQVKVNVIREVRALEIAK